MTSWQDIVNGIFKLCGAPFIILSIIKVIREKRVKGISLLQVFFFTLWGYWNLYYYPHLKQYASFMGGVMVVVANTIWFALLLYYSPRKGKRY